MKRKVVEEKGSNYLFLSSAWNHSCGVMNFFSIIFTRGTIITQYTIRWWTHPTNVSVKNLQASCVLKFRKNSNIASFISKYSKSPQMADSKMAVPADWRLVFGHPLPAKWRQFPANWRIFYGKFKFLWNWLIFFFWEIEIFIKLAFSFTIWNPIFQGINQIPISHWLNIPIYYFNHELKS